MKPCDLKNKGFTLIELMISLVILSIVIAGIYEVYIQMHKISVSQELKAQTQQVGRVAVDYLQQDLAMAGYRSKQYHVNKGPNDKILMATQNMIVFDRQMDSPTAIAGQNRIIKYYVKTDPATGKNNLYREVYTDFDDDLLHWVPLPTSLDTVNFPDQNKPAIEDVSLLTFKYYKMSDPLNPMDYNTLSGAYVNQVNRNLIVKIEVIIQSQSTKNDPLTGSPVVLTNSFTVIPVNLRTTETVNDQLAPGVVTGLHVVDTCQCNGPDFGNLSAKWDKNPEPDVAGYVLYWGRSLTTGAEGSVTVPIESLTDRSNPTWTIPGLYVSKAGDTNPTIYYVWARAYDNSLNFGPLCDPVNANPSPSIKLFGSGDDTAINVTKPTTPPTNFTAFNIIEDPTIGQNQIKLTWASDPEATKGYRIYRLEGSGVFSQPIYNYYSPIASESQLTSGVTTYIDADPSLKTCQDYRYAICSVNCDETLVRNYDVADFATLVKAPTNTADPTRPILSENTKGGYKRIFVGLTNPTRSGPDADFLYTMIYWKRGAYTNPYLDASGSPTVDYYVLPNSDCGIAGKFTGTGTITTIFNDENSVLPNNVEPNLTAPEYTLLAVSHYGCRTYATNNTTATVSPSLCADDAQFPGAPPINGGVNPNPPGQAYGGLVVGKSGGCLYNDSATGIETRQPVNFTFSYGGDGIVYDYSGVYVEKRENGNLVPGVNTWGPLWSSFSDTAPALDSDGHHYDYWFRLADCAYVNGANTTDITSDTDALKITGVAPGDINGQTGGKVSVFGSFSSIPGGSLFHNAVKFSIVNTADCNISIQRLDNITWNNTDAYLQKVIIGPSTPLGGTAAYSQDVTVPDGSTLSGTNRIASVAFTSNPLITDLGTTVGPSVAIPVTLVFANALGSVDQFVDMRNTTITLNAKYTNTSTNGTCSRNGTINVSLGPIIAGTVQDKPQSPTLPFAFVPGSTGITLPSIVVDGGTKVNVNGNVSDTDAALSTVRLYYKTTGQGVSTVDSSGFTQLNMLNPTSSLFTLNDGSTDNRLPISEGLRVWYYIVAKDADGNFDTAPAAGSGYFTYDQKMFNVCDKTPIAPVITATKTTTGGLDYGHITWPAVTKYTDGSDIQTSGATADTIKYDVYKQIGFSGSPAVIASDLTALTYDDPAALSQPVIYTVKAKNSCTDPGPKESASSNKGIICAGSSATCTVSVDPPSVAISTHWNNHPLDISAQVDLTVFICDRANDGSAWTPSDGYDPLSDITMTISSAAETSSITLYEVDGDSGVFKPLYNPSIDLPTSANAARITISGNPSLYNGVTLVQGATTISSLTDTVHFTTDAGITSCSGVNANLAVTTDPCSNTPSQVTGVTTPTKSGSNTLFSWNAVGTNTDGSTINDVSKYRIYKDGVYSKSLLATLQL